jgi:hypothetical protein
VLLVSLTIIRATDLSALPKAVAPAKQIPTRLLVVLAYSAEAGISISESVMTTFFGRLE